MGDAGTKNMGSVSVRTATCCAPPVTPFTTAWPVTVADRADADPTTTSTWGSRTASVPSICPLAFWS